MKTLGNFGKLAKSYHRGRRGFDNGVFDFLAKQVNDLKDKKVLDVGCGTGIATRQLARFSGKVTGSDISNAMIAKALQNSNDIEYVVSPTHNLPFGNGSFDLVTAFSSFHWFTDSDSINEIKRVLKRGGLFAVINKNDVSGIRKDVNRIFAKYIDTKNVKQDYDPEKILKNSGFEEVATYTVTGSEIFTFEGAVTYLQSIALWNLVPKGEKHKLLIEIEDFCDHIKKQRGILKRDLETVIVAGWLPDFRA